MITETVPYTDFDGHPAEETVHFYISKTELADNLYLQDRLESVLEIFKGGEREITRPELEELLELVKTFMRLAYGVRDGKYFRKSDELWADFKDSGVYDEYLYSLFVNPEKANNFLLGVLPQDLREEAAVVAAEKTPDVELKADSTNEISDAELLKMHPQDMTPEQGKRAYELRFGKK